MMIRTILYIVFLVIPIVGVAQKDSLWQDSIYQKAKLFFTKVGRIELVKLETYCTTYEYTDEQSGEVKEEIYCREESVLRPDNYRCPIDTSHVGEQYGLQKQEFDELFSLLYEGELSFSAAACYNPRHGIVFYNSAGSIIGFLEICFECHRMYSLPDTPNMGPLEGGVFKKLQLFFQGKGL